MSDVRLTATNPLDSSVVPVACNQRGELLTVPPVIEQIDNDVTINGAFRVDNAGSVFALSRDQSYCLTTLAANNVAGGSQTSGCYFSFGTFTNFSVPVVGVNSAFVDGGVNSSSYITGFKCNITQGLGVSAGGPLCGYYSDVPSNANNGIGPSFNFYSIGSAPNFFKGEVIVGSRNKTWTLVEQGGLCHLVEYQNAYSTEDEEPLEEEKYPNLRNVFTELDHIESALEQVMTKLRMVPPANWEVWDGSNETV